MQNLIGLLLNLAAITASVLGNHHDALTLTPTEHTLMRYTDETLLVLCHSSNQDAKLHWQSPKGEAIVEERKGRIHVEKNESASQQLKLVFKHIALADKGKWSCVDDASNVTKSFDLIVYQKITFTENSTILTVKEGKNATILCEVKGEPMPDVTWHYNGQPININANFTKFRILADGLLINKVTQNDTGEYTCRAYQVNMIASDMKERTVLMKIEHKPFWTHKHHPALQYAYPNGSVTIMCEAIAEPPATFTWIRGLAMKQRLNNDSIYRIETDNYSSMLTILVRNDSVFDTYKCRAQNSLGGIERTTALERGTKPPPPSVLQLRGFNSNTFDVDVGSVRTSPPLSSPMEVNGFRIEYITEHDFKYFGGNWTNAKRKDFPFEDGATFLISNLEANTTYFMRAASRNLAGLSDWTKVEIFRTLSNEPPSASAPLQLPSAKQLLCISLVARMLGSALLYRFPAVRTYMDPR